jgi:putative RNA 2'-phosphotransferase
MDKKLVKLSKFLSLVLRHKPETIDLSLDENGWADVDQLLYLANQKQTPLTLEILEEIVLTNEKKRFAFSENKSKIRANQGHSIDVDLALISQQPPQELFHGTATRFLESIRDRGLISGSRQHVHLSLDKNTAIQVGKRHGKPVVLTISAEAMNREGFVFFRSENGVWLTENVPIEFIKFPSEDTTVN